MNRSLIDAINIQAKREGYFLPLLRAIVFERLRQQFPDKQLLNILDAYRGGNWGGNHSAGLLPAPSLRSPDIRHGWIDTSQAEIRYYTSKELEKHHLVDGDILVIKSNGSLDLVGKSQLYSTNNDAPQATASNFILILRPDRSQVDPSYLDCFLKSPQALVWRVDKQRTTTGLRNLDTDGYLATQVPLPPALETQKEIVTAIELISNGVWDASSFFDIQLAKKAKQISELFEKLEVEACHQKALIVNLKQAILQEAIQGKLTADWRADHPDVEPASHLLHRIQAEKDRLIASRKLRKEKPLPKISSEEIPFDIPKGWEWCCLGRLIDKTESGWSPACHKHPAPEGKWGVLKTTAIQNGQYIDGENKELPASLDPRPEHEAFAGDILMTRAGPANRVGICALVRETRPWLMISDKIIRFRPVLVSGAYIELFANTPLFQKLIDSSKQGMAESQVNISQKNLKATPIPLPPLAEQVVIFERVESLMKTCRALEDEIEHARNHAAQLLQAVLKEAFAPV